MKPLSPEDFTDGLFRNEVASLVSRHMMAASGNPDKLAEIYEVLGTALATSVAQGCCGNQAVMGRMIEGLCGHIVEVASERQPIMAMLYKFKK
jgi:hypothetical protein